MNLVESVRPNVSSPFLMDETVVGSKDTETSSVAMAPCLKRLCVTVGMLLCLDGNREPNVRLTGPILQRIVLTQLRIIDRRPRSPQDTVNAVKTFGGLGNTHGLP